MNTPNPNPSPERERLKYYPDYIDDPDGLERFRQAVLSNSGHDMAAVNHNSLGRLIDTIERLRRERDAALSPQTLPAPGEVEAGSRNLYLLQVDNARMAEALRQCRDQFAFYAREHYAAGKSEKGDTNTRFADISNKALTAVKPATVAAANDEGVAEHAAQFADGVAEGAQSLYALAARDRDTVGTLIHGEAVRVAKHIASAIRLLPQGAGK